MMMLNGGLASPSQGKPLKKAKKVAAEKEKNCGEEERWWARGPFVVRDASE